MKATKPQPVIIILSACAVAVVLVIGTLYLVASDNGNLATAEGKSTTTLEDKHKTTEDPDPNQSPASGDTANNEYDHLVEALDSAIKKNGNAEDVTSPSEDSDTGTRHAITLLPKWGTAVREGSWSNSAELNSDSCSLLSGDLDLPQDTTAAVLEWTEQPEIATLFRGYRAYVLHSEEGNEGAETTELQQLVSALATSLPNCNTLENESLEIQITGGEDTSLGNEGFQEANWLVGTHVDDSSYGTGRLSYIANNFVWNEDYAVYIQMFEAPHEERPYGTDETITEPWYEAAHTDVPKMSKRILTALGVGEPAELPNIQPPPDEVPDEIPGEDSDDSEDFTDGDGESDSDDFDEREKMCESDLIPDGSKIWEDLGCDDYSN